LSGISSGSKPIDPMAENLERAEDRLDNIRSVEPILSALRTISHSSWQNARRKLHDLRGYHQRLTNLIAYILPHIKPPPGSKISDRDGSHKTILLVLGSERGLCGRFHIDLANHLHFTLSSKQDDDPDIELWVIGSRLKHRLERRGCPISWFQPTSPSGIPNFDLTFEWLGFLLKEYEEGKVETILLMHNVATRGGRIQPQTVQLIPPILSSWNKESNKIQWPPPIIETDPNALYARLIEQHLATQFLQTLLESAAAEHSTRFHLMEEATKNAERLMEELKNLVQLSRRQAITQEMEELIVGSGLLKDENDFE